MNPEEIDTLINALQLSINTKIQHYKVEEGQLLISFAKNFNNDKNLENFILITNAQVKKNKVIYLSLKTLSPNLSSFLMLSRLAPRHMKKISDIDARFKSYMKKISQENSKEVNSIPLLSVQQASQTIEQAIKKKQMTLRELSDKTGLTQVSLSNFKSGKDVRLSNFLKIVDALDLKVTIN